MDSYAFFDGDGNEITRGLQLTSDQARAHAQAMANDRDIAVEYQPESELSGLEDGEEPVTGEVVEPE